MDLKGRHILLDKLETALLEIQSGLDDMREAVKSMREDCKKELSKVEVS